jgi:RNA polymerase sigma factor (sigma-70 family)
MMTKTLALQTEYPPQPDLVDRCISGERLAQKQLYDQYKAAMFTIALRILNDYDMACDALQDAFLEVFRDLKTFKRQSTIGAWIKTIVIRQAVKKNKFEYRYLPFDANEHDTLVEQLQQIASADIDKAINQLPDGYRSVFTLVTVEGYSHKETAAILGISEVTSRSQLHHAKKQLQTLLIELKP